MDNKKKIFSFIFFCIIMGLTFYTFLNGKNLKEIFDAIQKIDKIFYATAMFCGILFVSLEGIMISYLMKIMGDDAPVIRCIEYSFIGFFYSGITPSATGGQPMQLYYMKKDGKKMSNSTVTLMTVAFMYKFVLVLIGIFLIMFWNGNLILYLGRFYILYLVGLFLNILLVIFIGSVMIYPNLIKYVGICIINKLTKWRVIKESKSKIDKWSAFICSYEKTVKFLKRHRLVLLNLMLMTFVQRCSVFFVTYLVYCGFHLYGENPLTVMMLQAAVYIAVDMLPIPGSQGITEIMYTSVFTKIFTKTLLMPSMLVSRSINFYFLLVISMVLCGIIALKMKRKEVG